MRPMCDSIARLATESSWPVRPGSRHLRRGYRRREPSAGAPRPMASRISPTSSSAPAGSSSGASVPPYSVRMIRSLPSTLSTPPTTKNRSLPPAGRSMDNSPEPRSAIMGAWPGKTPTFPSTPARPPRPPVPQRVPNRARRRDLQFRHQRRELLASRDDLVDPAFHVKRLLGQVVQLTRHHTLKGLHGIVQPHVLSGDSGERLGDVERLARGSRSILRARSPTPCLPR